MSEPHLAFVIVSWNVRGLLAACLRSLFTDLESWGLDAEIWVVDNASSDGTPGMVEEMWPEVRLIANEENLGFVKGNNLALRQITSYTNPNLIPPTLSYFISRTWSPMPFGTRASKLRVSWSLLAFGLGPCL